MSMVSQAPVLEACRVSVTDSWGNDKESTIVGNKTSCDSQQDEAVSTVPAKVYFILKADLNLSVGSPLPQYVSASSVGIVAAKTSLEKKNLRLILPEEDATRLYAVILEVHDKAGNVAYARRLVLYDNTSTVLINSSASLQVGSADPR
nr:hypothetical protein BaRGS_030075 [Batillaria attramentaria]